MEKVGIIVGSTAAVRITAADIAVTNYITIPRAGGKRSVSPQNLHRRKQRKCKSVKKKCKNWRLTFYSYLAIQFFSANFFPDIDLSEKHATISTSGWKI